MSIPVKTIDYTRPSSPDKTNTAGTIAANGPGIALPSGQSVLSASYTITASGAYQDTGLTVAIPAAGTYLITYNVRATIAATATGPGTVYATCELYDSVAAAAIANSQREIVLDNICVGTICQLQSSYSFLATFAGATTLHLYAQRVETGTIAWGLSEISSDSVARTTLAFVQIA